MCGRFTLIADLSIIEDTFHIQEIDGEYHPSNNISPGQQIPAVIHDNKLRLVTFRWGLIPSWAKDTAIGNNIINARAESVTNKPSFSDAFRKRRCLIIADGFYEWAAIGKKRCPIIMP